MKKHFVSRPKNYEALNDALSDTEVDYVRDSKETLQTNETKKKISPPKPAPRKTFLPLKIKEEVKIDLRKNEDDEAANIQSAHKIFPIDEISENSSRDSSKMRIHQIKKQQEIQRLLESNKRSAMTRPGSRRPEQKSPISNHDGIQVHLLHKPFYSSELSITGSEFLDDKKNKTPERKESQVQTQRDPQFGSLSSFKRAQIHRLSLEAVEMYNQRWSREMQGYNDDMITVKSYNTSLTSTSESCFGCIFKPLSSICRKKKKQK
jgi:hypothetical protein